MSKAICTRCKYCKYCNKIKDTSEFYLVSKKRPILRERCKNCYLVISKERKKVYRSNPKTKEKERNYSHEYYYTKGKFERKRTDKTRKTEREYNRKRQRENAKFAIEHRLRARMSSIVRKKLMRKSRKSLEYLGCTSEEFMRYMESLFPNGMTWGNRKLWHIDHIVPVCSFDLTQEGEIKKCFHYSNLRPIWKEGNLRKGISDRKLTVNINSKYYVSKMQ